MEHVHLVPGGSFTVSAESVKRSLSDGVTYYSAPPPITPSDMARSLVSDPVANTVLLNGLQGSAFAGVTMAAPSTFTPSTFELDLADEVHKLRAELDALKAELQAGKYASESLF